MMFHLNMRLDVTVTPPEADLFDATDRFMAELHALGDQDGRLDCTVGVERAADGSGTGTIEVDLDVEAEAIEPAFVTAMSWLRTALHASGVPTPGWDLGTVRIDPQVSLACA